MCSKLFKLSFLNIKRNKNKNIINIFIIGIFVVSLIVSTNLSSLIKLSDYISNSDSSMVFQEGLLVKLKNILDILTIFISILAFLCLNIIIKNSVDERIYEVAIYKSVGYKNKYLFLLFLFELIIIVSASYVLSVFFSKIILYIAVNFISNRVGIFLESSNIFYQYIYPLLILYFISFFTSYITLFKIKNISIKKLLID